MKTLTLSESAVAWLRFRVRGWPIKFRNDATGRVRPITPEEQARNARAIADLVVRMLAMPDEDPPEAWDDAMRDLDAHRPHRKLFEGLY